MKVLQTIPSLQVSWGGPSTCTCDLLEGLYDVNANVDLLTSDAACADDVVLGKGRPWMDRNGTPLYSAFPSWDGSF